MIKRINFYEGPGIGKTTISTDIFARIKNKIIHQRLPIQIELVTEYVKTWAWEGRKPQGFDQIYICAQQMRREEIPLRNGVDVIITDSPLLLQCAYAKKYGVPGWENLVSLVEKFEEVYPSLHVSLKRDDRPYISSGRYQNQDEAKEMDECIKNMLNLYVKEYTSISCSDVEGIEDFVVSHLLNGSSH